MNRGVFSLRCWTGLPWVIGWLPVAMLWSASGPKTSAQPAPPRITRQPADLVVAPGGAATFMVVATGDAPLAYHWYFNLLTAIPGGTNATLVLTNVQPANAGTYQAVIDNPAGIVNSVEARL